MTVPGPSSAEKRPKIDQNKILHFSFPDPDKTVQMSLSTGQTWLEGRAGARCPRRLPWRDKVVMSASSCLEDAAWDKQKLKINYSLLRNSASGLEIGPPGRISAGF